MKQHLIYKDTSTGISHKLYTLTTDNPMEIGALIRFADLTMDNISDQLGFDIDYDNLTTVSTVDNPTDANQDVELLNHFKTSTGKYSDLTIQSVYDLWSHFFSEVDEPEDEITVNDLLENIFRNNNITPVKKSEVQKIKELSYYDIVKTDNYYFVFRA